MCVVLYCNLTDYESTKNVDRLRVCSSAPRSRDQPDIPTESPSGNVGLDPGAFLLTTVLFERANQIAACPINYWGGPLAPPSTCGDANW